jgi:flagellar assembly factor FliW
MPSIETKYFGTLPYAESAVFDFPRGLPAFEEERSFVLIELPRGDVPQADASHEIPLLFLQSMSRANLCFAAFPILVVDEKYELAIAPEDLQELELDTRQQPALGAEVMVLALISLHGKFVATANLMAPVVLNVKTRRGLQAIRRDSLYSHEHPIAGQPPGEETAHETNPPETASGLEQAC